VHEKVEDAKINRNEEVKKDFYRENFENKNAKDTKENKDKESISRKTTVMSNDKESISFKEKEKIPDKSEKLEEEIISDRPKNTIQPNPLLLN